MTTTTTGNKWQFQKWIGNIIEGQQMATRSNADFWEPLKTQFPIR